jgi:uncharacterized protein (DUF4415 family)
MSETPMDSSSHKTDWDALEKMSDDQIDYSDIPPLGDDFFQRAMLRIPAEQAKRMVPLDPEVLNWFRAKDPNYPSLINSVLRGYMARE